MTLLDNRQFDNGSFECYNFWVADCDGTYQVDATNKLIQDLKPRILSAIKLGASHINTRNLEVVYCGCRVLEVQWG